MTSATLGKFSSLPVRPELLDALRAVGYEEMTAIQRASAGPVLDGRDLIAQAETGSGKTAAFGIGAVSYTHLTLPTIYSV